MTTFDFEARRHDGRAMSGSLAASSAEDAREQLAALGLAIDTLRPAARPALRASMSHDDLALFNEQLIQLTQAGLPMERGLSLLADDLERSNVKRAMQSLAGDLSSGKSIESAVESRRTEFPPIYAKLIDAGVRTGNLPGVLHGFGKHLETVSRLRSELWRAAAYPMVVLIAFALLLTFLSYLVLPQYYALIKDISFKSYNWRTGDITVVAFDMPLPARVLNVVGLSMPYLLGAGLLAAVVVWGVWRMLKISNQEGPWVDAVVLRIPVLGRALKQSYLTRWVDTLAIGVRSGLDLPQAIGLASQVIALPSLKSDGDEMINLLASGRGLDQAPRLRRVPASIPPSMELASQSNRLPQFLDSLARELARQTEQRIRMIPAVLTPLLVILIGLCAGIIILGLWSPMARMFNAMTGV
jgi:type II secretory pathway component PulF